MKYMLLIYANPEGWDEVPEAERQATTDEYMRLQADPHMFGGNQLQRAAAATTVRVDGTRTITTDGPFIEAKEELGGYYLLEADDEQTAIELAARVPAARSGGAVEVRPLVEQ
jgi:hypothetical protein